MPVDGVSRKSEDAERQAGVSRQGSEPPTKGVRANDAAAERSLSSSNSGHDRAEMSLTSKIAARSLSVPGRCVRLSADAVLLTLFAPFYLGYISYRAFQRMRGKSN
jgi:hypothetical protein